MTDVLLFSFLSLYSSLFGRFVRRVHIMRPRTESRRRSSKLSSSGSRSRRLSDYVKHISYDANLQFFKFTRSWKRNKWHSFLVIFTRPVLPPLLGQKHGSHHGPKNSRNFNSFQLPSRLSNGLSFYQRPSTNKSLANRQNRPEELNMCDLVPWFQMVLSLAKMTQSSRI